MINLQIRQFKNSIIGIANASPLPLEVKRLVFAEIKEQLEAESNKAIALEKAEAAKEVNKANKAEEGKDNE